MNNSAFVILVPAFNTETTIAETLQSIQQQGPALQRIREVIIADDGSQDRTIEVARATWTSQVPLRVIEAPRNRGEYTNVNEAVASLDDSITWLLILHSDDSAKRQWLREMVTAIDQADERIASVCTSWDDLLLDGSIAPGEHADGIREFAGTTAAVHDTLLRGCWWHISGCAIRLQTYREVGGLPKDLRQKGDWDFLLRFLSAGWGVVYIPRSLIVYRQGHTTSSSRAFTRHFDVRETLQVIRWHQQVLTRGELLKLHAWQLKSLARRTMGSVLERNSARFFGVFPAAIGVVDSLVQSLRGHIERTDMPTTSSTSTTSRV